MKTHRILRNPILAVLVLSLGAWTSPVLMGQETVFARTVLRMQSIAAQHVVAQTETKTAAPAGARPRTAAAELKRARDLLTKHSSIRARIVEQVTLSDRSYRAEGRYLQLALKPGDWKMRMELNLKVGESEGSMLEVCNGTILWTMNQIDAGIPGKKKDAKNKERFITRRNVQEILDAVRKSGDFSEQREADLLTNLGLGGLPALLTNIEQDMKLGGMKEETFRERTVIVLSGTWSEAVASRMRRPNPDGSVGLLPPTVPDQVRLYLDKETGFPYRVLYLKKIPGREVMKPMLVLDFRDVVLNEPIPASEFDYTAPDKVEALEITNSYIERLTQQPGGERK